MKIDFTIVLPTGYFLYKMIFCHVKQLKKPFSQIESFDQSFYQTKQKPKNRTKKQKNQISQDETVEKKENGLTLDDIDPKASNFEELMDKLVKIISSKKDLTPCTLENFNKWKQQKKEEKKKKEEEKAKKKRQKNGNKGLTGKELFRVDDEQATDKYIYEKESKIDNNLKNNKNDKNENKESNDNNNNNNITTTAHVNDECLFLNF